MICLICGNSEIKPDHRYCMICGLELKKEKAPDGQPSNQGARLIKQLKDTTDQGDCQGDWATLSAEKGVIYCRIHDTWCCYTNHDDGSCSRCVCVKEGAVLDVL